MCHQRLDFMFAKHRCNCWTQINNTISKLSAFCWLIIVISEIKKKKKKDNRKAARGQLCHWESWRLQRLIYFQSCLLEMLKTSESFNPAWLFPGNNNSTLQYLKPRWSRTYDPPRVSQYLRALELTASHAAPAAKAVEILIVAGCSQVSLILEP